MTAHTPRGWRIVERFVEEDGSVYPRSIEDAEDRSVCFLELECISQLAVKHPGTHWDTSPIKETHARLIAAAPELLEAWQKAHEWMKEAVVAGCNLPSTATLFRSQAAIAKAPGSQP